MGDADRIGHQAGIVDVLAGAARAGASRDATVIIELERHADCLVAGLSHERGRYRAIHSARHRDNYAGSGSGLCDPQINHAKACFRNS